MTAMISDPSPGARGKGTQRMYSAGERTGVGAYPGTVGKCGKVRGLVYDASTLCLVFSGARRPRVFRADRTCHEAGWPAGLAVRPSLVRQPETLAGRAAARRRRTSPRTRVGSVNFSPARGPRMGSPMDGPKREACRYSYCGQSSPGLSRFPGRGCVRVARCAITWGYLPVCMTCGPQMVPGAGAQLWPPSSLPRAGQPSGGRVCGAGSVPRESRSLMPTPRS